MMKAPDNHRYQSSGKNAPSTAVGTTAINPNSNNNVGNHSTIAPSITGNKVAILTFGDVLILNSQMLNQY